jgi:hypothetical protein
MRRWLRIVALAAALVGAGALQALAQDATEREVERYRQMLKIAARETAAIRYPSDGNLMGDWKKGEKLSQSGYGWRFTDYPPRQENGASAHPCARRGGQGLRRRRLGLGQRRHGRLPVWDVVAAHLKGRGVVTPQAPPPSGSSAPAIDHALHLGRAHPRSPPPGSIRHHGIDKAAR